MLFSSFSTRSMVFAYFAKAQLPFSLFRDLFNDTAEFTLCYGLHDCSPLFQGYFIHSLSTLYYYNAPSLATRLTGDYRDRTYTGKCSPALLDTRKKNRGALGTPILNLLQNLQGWFIIRLENRRILECPTVAQSETYKALSLLTDYRLSPIGVEDSLSVYLRLRLLSMYVKAANTTSKSVSTSKVFIPTSFLFPERTTARLSLLL